MQTIDAKLIQATDKIINYYYSGVLAYTVLKTIQEEYLLNPQKEEDIFIGTLVNSTYNTILLTLANIIKSNPDSIDLTYLFSIIKGAKHSLPSDEYSRLVSIINHYEIELKKLEFITNRIRLLRDKSIAHVDRKHINNPISLVQSQSIKWKELETAYTIVGNCLLEIGDSLGVDPNTGDYTTIANFVLGEKTRQVFRHIYGVDKSNFPKDKE